MPCKRNCYLACSCSRAPRNLFLLASGRIYFSSSRKMCLQSRRRRENGQRSLQSRRPAASVLAQCIQNGGKKYSITYYFEAPHINLSADISKQFLFEPSCPSPTAFPNSVPFPYDRTLLICLCSSPNGIVVPCLYDRHTFRYLQLHACNLYNVTASGVQRLIIVTGNQTIDLETPSIC